MDRKHEERKVEMTRNKGPKTSRNPTVDVITSLSCRLEMLHMFVRPVLPSSCPFKRISIIYLLSEVSHNKTFCLSPRSSPLSLSETAPCLCVIEVG